jgi:hypothetical protein
MAVVNGTESGPPARMAAMQAAMGKGRSLERDRRVGGKEQAEREEEEDGERERLQHDLGFTD